MKNIMHNLVLTWGWGDRIVTVVIVAESGVVPDDGGPSYLTSPSDGLTDLIHGTGQPAWQTGTDDRGVLVKVEEVLY